MKRHSILYGRIAYSLIIILAYLIGRSIPIPWTASAAEQGAEGLTALFSGILGGRTELTLFSLGMTPWIVATIAAQALNPLIRKYTSNEASVRGWLTALLTLILTVAMAVMQVQGAELVLTQNLPGPLQKGAAAILLTAGTFCIVWLARRNEDWGIGGQRLLILINLADTLWSSVGSFRKENAFSLWGENGSVSVIVLLLMLLAVIAVTVVFQAAEYRYPVHRLMIDSRYASKDYLAIRYNPAGTMPVMYTMALLSMLSSCIAAMASLLPAAASDAILNALNLRSLPGLILFLLLLRVMTGVAAAFTMDPAKTADDLKRSGAYIEGKHPGKATEKFLRKAIRRAANLSSVVMGLILVLPYVYVMAYADTDEIGNIPVTVVLLTGILIELAQECLMYYSMQDYRPILEVEGRELSDQEVEKIKEEVDLKKDCAEGPERGTYYFLPVWEEDIALSERGGKKVEETDVVTAVAGEVPKKASATGSGEKAPESAPVASEEKMPERGPTISAESRNTTQEARPVVPSLPVYDDIVHQLKLFRVAGEQVQLMALSYLPQMGHFLHYYRLENIPYWSVYDELQGISLQAGHRTYPAVLRWQDLDWKKLGRKGTSRKLIWIPVNGVMRGYEEGRRVFDVHFTSYGTVYYVDHYDEKDDTLRVDRRSIFDDRGFLSSSIEFKPINEDPKADVSKTPAGSEDTESKAEKSRESSKSAAVQRFYNPNGKEQFYITFPSGRVTFKTGHDCPFSNRRSFGSVSEMVESRLNAHLSECKGNTAFFLAAKGEADDIVRRAECYAQGNRKVVLSFYEGRYAQWKDKKETASSTVLSDSDSRGDEKGTAPATNLSDSDGGGDKKGTASAVDLPDSDSKKDGEGKANSGKTAVPYDYVKGEAIKQYKSVSSMIFVDTEAKREYFEQFEYVDPEEDRRKRRRVPVEDVYPCEMQSRTNRSASSPEVVIFMPADGMFEEDIPGRASYIIKHIEYLMREDAAIHLWLGTEKGEEYLPEFDRECKEWLEKYRRYKSKNAGNLLYVEKGWNRKRNAPTTPEERMMPEKARTEAEERKNNELKAMHDRIRSVSYQTEWELDDILETARLVLDPRTVLDLRLQAAAVCYGIPQVVRASSRYVVNTESGYVCKADCYIVDGLHYYLDGLANWNRTHEICAQMMRQYSQEACTQQVQQWMRLIEEGETGQ